MLQNVLRSQPKKRQKYLDIIRDKKESTVGFARPFLLNSKQNALIRYLERPDIWRKKMERN